VVTGLREHAFRQFPADEAPLDLEIRQRFETQTARGAHFRFTGEPGWRLNGTYTRRLDWQTPHGVVISLHSPDDLHSADVRVGGVHVADIRSVSAAFVGRLTERYGVAHVETRGTAEAGWAPALSWHVRRAAAILGRTVAGMRVYDTLRAIEAVRALAGVDPQGIDPEHIILAARGEMTVAALCAALCAALLDGQVEAVALYDPPATLNQPSRPDGTGEAIELLNALRITDLPEMAGLLWPAELVFVGRRPESYRWAEDVYGALGAPGVVRHVKRLDDWRGVGG
jgi:hypothetical protein